MAFVARLTTRVIWQQNVTNSVSVARACFASRVSAVPQNSLSVTSRWRDCDFTHRLYLKFSLLADADGMLHYQLYQQVLEHDRNFPLPWDAHNDKAHALPKTTVFFHHDWL